MYTSEFTQLSNFSDRTDTLFDLILCHLVTAHCFHLPFNFPRYSILSQLCQRIVSLFFFSQRILLKVLMEGCGAAVDYRKEPVT